MLIIFYTSINILQINYCQLRGAVTSVHGKDCNRRKARGAVSTLHGILPGERTLSRRSASSLPPLPPRSLSLSPHPAHPPAPLWRTHRHIPPAHPPAQVLSVQCSLYGCSRCSLAQHSASVLACRRCVCKRASSWRRTSRATPFGTCASLQAMTLPLSPS